MSLLESIQIQPSHGYYDSASPDVGVWGPFQGVIAATSAAQAANVSGFVIIRWSDRADIWSQVRTQESPDFWPENP